MRVIVQSCVLSLITVILSVSCANVKGNLFYRVADMPNLIGILLISVTDLHPDKVTYVSGQRNALGFDVKSLNIFCWTGRQKLISHYFETANFHLQIDNDDFLQYQGSDTEAILQDIENKKSLFSFNFLWSTKRDSVPLNVFNNTCIGVETAQEYQVVLQIIQYDTAKVVLLIVGTLLLFVSGRLSENSLFYYICGISFGVAASFLILVYFVSKVFPRKALMYGSLAFGWSIVFYFGRVVWQNLQMLVQTYGEYLVYYCLVTGIISFIICYRYGPPTDKRSKNLIKWSIQGLALILVWASTDLKEVAGLVAITLLSLYYSPKCSMGSSWTFWPRSKKRRLISMEEFERQGAIETAKALENLKRFCSSPECNQWRTISRLKDPSRFASFIEGDSHVRNNEIIDHETSEFYQYSEEEENVDNSDAEEVSFNSRGSAGDHLISEEDDYDEPPPPPASRRNTSVRREKEVYVSGGHRRIIANSRFRAERTPPAYIARHTPQSRRKYHLSDED